MTNTLHRFGDAASFRDDYVIFAIASKGSNDQGALEKLAPGPWVAREDTPDGVVTAVRRLMDEVVAALGIDGDVQVSQQGDTISATVRGEDLGILIGKHGQTIDAVQYLANSMLHRHGRGVEAVIDAEGYRARRERTLGEVAARAVDEVRRTGQPVALEPMSSAERKIVHNKVQDIPGMATSSEGAEPNRYVVVAPSEE